MWDVVAFRSWHGIVSDVFGTIYEHRTGNAPCVQVYAVLLRRRFVSGRFLCRFGNVQACVGKGGVISWEAENHRQKLRRRLLFAISCIATAKAWTVRFRAKPPTRAKRPRPAKRLSVRRRANRRIVTLHATKPKPLSKIAPTMGLQVWSATNARIATDGI